MKRSMSKQNRYRASSSVSQRGLAVVWVASFMVATLPGGAGAKHPPCLSVPAIGMFIESDYADDYDIDDGRVRLWGASSKKAVLLAPVFNLTGKRDVGWTHFSVLYTDRDGLGTIDPNGEREPGKEPPRTNQARVQAVLKFVDQTGSPPQEVVALDSNDPKNPRTDDEERFKETRHMRVEIPKKKKLNFERNYYFVEITLTREPNRGNAKNPHYPDVLGFRLCKQFK